MYSRAKKEEEDHSFFIRWNSVSLSLFVTITIIFIVMPRYFSSFLVFICFLLCRNIILHFCLNLCCSISRIRRPPSNGNSAMTGFTKSSNSPFAIDMYTIPRARSRTGTQSELLLPFSFRFQFQFLVIIAPHTHIQGNIELSCNRKRTYTQNHLHRTTRNKRTSGQ